jgi:hypothetical protein
VFLDEVEHRRTCVHECLDQFAVHHAERLRLQVSKRVGLRQVTIG